MMRQSFFFLLLCCFQASTYANQAVINPNGVLEINGKPVFVIGFTTAPEPGTKTPQGKEAIDELADAGATFLRAGPLGMAWTEERFANEKKMEDAAAAHGLYCWLNLREAAEIKGKKQEELLRRIVTTFKDHPGLGVYKGADEPAWGKAPIAPLERAYKLLKQLDPNHPLAIIDAPGASVDSVRKYNGVRDIVGFDIYPIGYPPGRHSPFVKTNNEISMVGDFTRRAMEVANGSNALWMTLQIAWSGVGHPGKTLRFPTFPEERFMSYQAIINGARGLVYFGGAIPQTLSEEDRKLGWNWHFWNRVLRPVVEEIGTKSPLYPALLVPESKLPVKVKGNGIEFCVREVGSDIFVIACKRDHTTELIEFSGLPATAKGGEVLFEEPRTVELKRGKFSDWIAPFEVHVYRFKKGGSPDQ